MVGRTSGFQVKRCFGTAERLEVVDFSDPYFYASIVTLTKADSKYASAASVADLYLNGFKTLAGEAAGAENVFFTGEAAE